MAAHAKLSASGAFRWMACPGSVKAEEGLPDTTSPAAAEGTKAHELAERVLTKEQTLKAAGADGYDAEMIRHIADYVKYVKAIERDGEHAASFIEERLDFTEWVPGGFGTADASIIMGTTLHVVDLKYGKGVRVFAANNPQLRLYGLAALQRWQFEHGINTIVMHIFQPRVEDGISSETMPVEELLEWGETVRKAALAALTDDAPRVPSDKACQWCRANPCRTRAMQVLQRKEKAPLIASEFALLVDQARDAIDWGKAIITGAERLAMDGEHLPGYKLVAGRATRKLRGNADEILKKLGVNVSTLEMVERKRTLKAIEDDLGGSKAATPVLDKITTKPDGKPTLVKASDPRPEISGITDEDFL